MPGLCLYPLTMERERGMNGINKGPCKPIKYILHGRYAIWIKYLKYRATTLQMKYNIPIKYMLIILAENLQKTVWGQCLRIFSPFLYKYLFYCCKYIFPILILLYFCSIPLSLFSPVPFTCSNFFLSSSVKLIFIFFQAQLVDSYFSPINFELFKGTVRPDWI